jgi:selT/selW/selH-like putative selenoprotein
LAAAIKDAKGVQPSLFVGRVGAFEVKVGEKQVFSKLSTGRFPSNDEVIAALD